MLRPHGAPLSRVWALLGDGACGPQLSLAPARVEPIIPASVKVGHALQGRLLWRFWPLPTGEACLLRARGSLLRGAPASGRAFRPCRPAPLRHGGRKRVDEMDASVGSARLRFAPRAPLATASKAARPIGRVARRHLGRTDSAIKRGVRVVGCAGRPTRIGLDQRRAGLAATEQLDAPDVRRHFVENFGRSLFFASRCPARHGALVARLRCLWRPDGRAAAPSFDTATRRSTSASKPCCCGALG